MTAARYLLDNPDLPHPPLRLAFTPDEEIGRGVMFLIADDAGFITGSTLSINGGQHMY